MMNYEGIKHLPKLFFIFEINFHQHILIKMMRIRKVPRCKLPDDRCQRYNAAHFILLVLLLDYRLLYRIADRSDCVSLHNIFDCDMITHTS